MNYDKLFEDKFEYKLNACRDLEPLKSYLQKKQGWVYIVRSNDNGLLKIGRTSKHPMERAKSLSSTGVLNEYEVLFSLKVFNQFLVEKKIHKALAKYRISKEFFSVDINKAITVIQKECDKEIKNFERFIDTNMIKEDLELIFYALK